MFVRTTGARRGALVVCLATAVGCGGPGPEDSPRLNALTLTMVAAQALEAKRTEDAAFLYLASKVRYAIDRAVYPPVGQGGDDPGVLMAALSSVFGRPALAAAVDDPAVVVALADRFATWKPEFPPAYDPGWKHRPPLTGQAVDDAVRQALDALRAGLRDKARLAGDEEYRRLSQVVKDTRPVEQRWSIALNQAKGKAIDPALQAEYAAAMKRRTAAAERMAEIEFTAFPEKRWHPVVKWKAEDFFSDPKVVELCRAIEADDIPAMEQAVAAGADVRVVGRDGMTPLVWAFPERRYDRFRWLLEHGADPNVRMQSDFGAVRPLHVHPTGGRSIHDRGCRPGSTITHLAAVAPEIRYLEAVLAHGGDPNILDASGSTPLDVVLDCNAADVRERVELLVGRGADVNHAVGGKATPLMIAVQHNRFGVARFLIDSGADPFLQPPERPWRVVHEMPGVRRADDPVFLGAVASNPDHEALVAWLEDHGESLAAARTEFAEWRERGRGASDFGAHYRAIAEERARAGRKVAPVLGGGGQEAAGRDAASPTNR